MYTLIIKRISSFDGGGGGGRVVGGGRARRRRSGGGRRRFVRKTLTTTTGLVVQQSRAYLSAMYFFFFLLRVRRGTHRHYIIAYTGLSPSVVTHTLARAYTGVRVNAVSAFFYPVRRRFLFVGQVRPDDRFTSPTGIFSISAYIIYLHSIIYSITMSCTGYTDIH